MLLFLTYENINKNRMASPQEDPEASIEDYKNRLFISIKFILMRKKSYTDMIVPKEYVIIFSSSYLKNLRSWRAISKHLAEFPSDLSIANRKYGCLHFLNDTISTRLRIHE